MDVHPHTSSIATRCYLYGAALLLLVAFGTGCADDPVVSGGGGSTEDENENGEDENGGGDNENTACERPTGGECDGTTLRYCVGDDEREVACADIFEGGTCRRVALTAWCHAPAGKVCIVDEDASTSSQSRYARCDGDYSGCTTTGINEPSTCERNIGTCTASQVRTCLPGNQYYVYGCLSGQPRAYDCVAMSGRCADAACRDLEEGSECQTDVTSGNRYMICADGLRCEGETDISKWGVCVAE